MTPAPAAGQYRERSQEVPVQRMVVVNLPVRDLPASADFYRALGFAVDEDFCETEAVSVRVAPGVVAMLLSRERFAAFLGPDGLRGRPPTPALTSLAAGSRAEVDDVVDAALRHGGSPRAFVAEGALYGRSFADPDGHVWELICVPDGAPVP